MRKCLLFFTLIILISSCKKEAEISIEGKYIFLLQPDSATCAASQSPSFYINCDQYIEFTDTHVDMKLSDYSTRGTYERKGDQVNIYLFGSVMKFEIGTHTLTEINTRKVWRRMKGSSIWDLYWEWRSLKLTNRRFAVQSRIGDSRSKVIQIRLKGL